jgi:hypothetical protein
VSDDRQWTDPSRRWDDSGQSAVSVRTMVLQHDADIESLKAWRSELRGALALVKITLGTSLVSGLLAVIALAALIANAVPRP